MVTLRKSSDLAKLVGLITGDGHLQLKGWRGLVSFYSEDIGDIKSINELFKKLFDKGGRVYQDFSKGIAKKSIMRYKIFLISKEITKNLNQIGIPKGNKTNTLFLVPDWIVNGSKPIKKAYLSAIYDCEGCIYETKSESSSRWRIALEMYKRDDLAGNGVKFFEQIKGMLKDFGVETSNVRFKKGNLRKDGSISKGLIFDIEKPSFRNFYKRVNFENTVKRRKLETALNT